MKQQQPQVNPFDASAKPTAIISAWKSVENRVKDQGVIFLGSTKTGHKSVLGKIVQLNNVTCSGRPMKNDKFVGSSVSLRISPDQAEELVDIITDMPGRLFEMAITIDDVSLKVLTSNGKPTRAITFFADIVDVREVAATLVGDTFDSQDALDAFGEAAQSEANEGLADYQSMMDAARATAPVEGEVANAMA